MTPWRTSSLRSELPAPVELEARLGQLVVALAGVLAAARDVGGVGRDLVGDDALAHVVLAIGTAGSSRTRSAPWTARRRACGRSCGRARCRRRGPRSCRR